jgi:hypothetical protein
LVHGISYGLAQSEPIQQHFFPENDSPTFLAAITLQNFLQKKNMSSLMFVSLCGK